MYVSGGKKCSFLGKFDVLCFLATPVVRLALLLYYRQSHSDGTLHGSFLQDHKVIEQRLTQVEWWV